MGLDYMVEVPSDTRLWLKRLQTAVPRIRLRLAPESPAAPEARTIAVRLGADAWTRRRVRDGDRGTEYADSAIRRVVAPGGGLPGARSGSCYTPFQQDAQCFRQH